MTLIITLNEKNLCYLHEVYIVHKPPSTTTYAFQVTIVQFCQNKKTQLRGIVFQWHLCLLAFIYSVNQLCWLMSEKSSSLPE